MIEEKTKLIRAGFFLGVGLIIPIVIGVLCIGGLSSLALDKLT